MDLNDWIKIFDRLLPDSRAWDLIPDKTLRSFLEGLSVGPKNAHGHLADVFGEMLPSMTTYLHDWSEQFGSLIDLDADELVAEWAAVGGQNPDYIQTQIQSICSNCYVHEWWVPESDPVEARNPFSPTNLIESSYVLVNDVTDMYPNYIYEFGDGTVFEEDESVEFGDYDGYVWRLKRYPCPNVANEYPTYWYVGGETWPDYAHISPEKLRPLIRMIFKIKPVHTRCVLMVIPDGDEPYDIQDTIAATEEEYQDTVSPTDEEIQDYT
jgi:hypothetical protein